MKRCPFIYYIIFLLTALDIIFTVNGLKLGIIREGNPILSHFMGSYMGLTAICVLAYVGAAQILIYCKDGQARVRQLSTEDASQLVS